MCVCLWLTGATGFWNCSSIERECCSQQKRNWLQCNPSGQLCTVKVLPLKVLVFAIDRLRLLLYKCLTTWMDMERIVQSHQTRNLSLRPSIFLDLSIWSDWRNLILSNIWQQLLPPPYLYTPLHHSYIYYFLCMHQPVVASFMWLLNVESSVLHLFISAHSRAGWVNTAEIHLISPWARLRI